MKKKIWIGGIIFGVVVVGIILGIVFSTRSNTITLKCEKKTAETSTDSIATFTIRFKNNNMRLVESKNEVIVKSDAMKENIDVAYNAIQSQFGDYKEEKGVILKTSKSKDRISFTLTVDAMENPEMVEIVGSSITSKMTYEEVKKELEGRNFVCK